MHGLHEAFLTLGAFTVLSTAVFWQLKAGDGRAISQQPKKDLEVGD
jgi:hypothetical protein